MKLHNSWRGRLGLCHARLSARSLSREEYAAYLKLRGIVPAASYAARGTFDVA